jgi:hypothetical protein
MVLICVDELRFGLSLIQVLGSVYASSSSSSSLSTAAVKDGALMEFVTCDINELTGAVNILPTNAEPRALTIDFLPFDFWGGAFVVDVLLFI